jgi:hypothetical protein
VADLLAIGSIGAKLRDMKTTNAQLDRDDASHPESIPTHKQRIAHEAELIAQARKSTASGRVVSEERVDAWIDSLSTDHPLPPPRSSD